MTSPSCSSTEYRDFLEQSLELEYQINFDSGPCSILEVTQIWQHHLKNQVIYSSSHACCNRWTTVSCSNLFHFLLLKTEILSNQKKAAVLYLMMMNSEHALKLSNEKKFKPSLETNFTVIWPDSTSHADPSRAKSLHRTNRYFKRVKGCNISHISNLEKSKNNTIRSTNFWFFM